MKDTEIEIQKLRDQKSLAIQRQDYNLATKLANKIQKLEKLLLPQVKPKKDFPTSDSNSCD